jgi:hypothetical protein
MPTFTLSRVIQAPAAEVFAAFTDVENLPARVKGIVRVEKLTPGPVGTGTRFKETRVMFRREASETFEVAALVPNTRFELTASGCGAEYRCTYAFAPDPAGGTRVDLTVATRAVSFWAKLFTPLAFLMIGGMKKCAAQDLDDLRAAVEGAKRAA